MNSQMKLIVLFLVIGIVYGYDSDLESDASNGEIDLVALLRDEGTELIRTGGQTFIRQANTPQVVNGASNVIKPWLDRIQVYIGKSVQNNQFLMNDLYKLFRTFGRPVYYNNLYDMRDHVLSLVYPFQEKIEFTKIILKKSIKWFQTRLNNFPESPALTSLNDIKSDLDSSKQELDHLEDVVNEYVDKIAELPESNNFKYTYHEISNIFLRLQQTYSQTTFHTLVNRAIQKLEDFEY